MKAFHFENNLAMHEEGSTQRKVVDLYNNRKVESIGSGYYKMLEQGNRKKRFAMAIKNKRLGADAD